MSINAAIALALEAVTFGAGNSSCGEWIEARSERGVLALGLQSWVTGYLTGLSQTTDSDPTRGARMDDVFLWLDNQCRANPTGSLNGAVLRFVTAGRNTSAQPGR